MLDRLGYIVLSFAVCLMCVIPSSAWSYQSFVGVENLPVQDVPSAAAIDAADDVSSPAAIDTFDDSSLVSSEDIALASDAGISAQADTSSGLQAVSASDLVPYLSIDSSTAAIGLSVQSTLSFPTLGNSVTSNIIYPSTFPTGSVGFSSSGISLSASISIPSKSGNQTYDAISAFRFGPSGFSGPGSAASSGFVVNLDLSAFGDFSAFELSGVAVVGYNISGSSSIRSSAGYLELYVNGALVRTFYHNAAHYIDFADFVYSSDLLIQSIQFYCYPEFGGLLLDDGFSGNVFVYFYPAWSSLRYMTFSVLDSGLGKPAAADALDSNINSAQKMEGQVWEDFSSKFNGLSVSITDGIASAASLLGGLFNDLWTTMGDVKLIYFAPLYFGLLFWILGRVRR